MNWEDPDTIGRFLSVITRSSYGTFRLAATDAGGSLTEHLALLGGYLLRASAPSWWLSSPVLGAVRLWLRDRGLAAGARPVRRS